MSRALADTTYVMQVESIITMNPDAPAQVKAQAIYDLCPLRARIGTKATDSVLRSGAMILPIYQKGDVGFFTYHALRWLSRHRIDSKEKPAPKQDYQLQKTAN